MLNTKNPEFVKQTPKGFTMRVMMMVDVLWKKRQKKGE